MFYVIRKDAFKSLSLPQYYDLYVTSGDYKYQPNFQRYIEDKSDKLRAQGITMDIWK